MWVSCTVDFWTEMMMGLSLKVGEQMEGICLELKGHSWWKMNGGTDD